MPEPTFDRDIAARHDETSRHMFRPETLIPTVDFLTGLVGDGAALEFGVGTGRVAIALAERGVAVRGIDISPAMLAELRGKPGAERVATTEGNFATTRVRGRFRVVYLVYSTLSNLTSQDEQVACFQNAAGHLEPGGWFVIELFVPRLRALSSGERIHVFDVGPTHLGFDEYTSFIDQTLRSHHYWISGERARIFSARFRWVWPSELDLMARLAGMKLEERWAGWSREPFTDESQSHVSVWRKPCEPATT